MPWEPKTDFEEEIVNLQPDHDFIYGTLSEPQYNYPRPQAHIEYATSRRVEKKKQVENVAVNQMNGKLKVITEVQRMASTKPLGEQPTVDDWDNNVKIEQETIGMLRYHGIPLSVEQPLDEKVTIATFPVKNDIKVVRNGRRKIAYFFNDDVFQLKEKASDDSSQGIIESCKNQGDNDSLSDTTSNTTTSLSSYTYNTCGNDSDLTTSFNSAITDNEIPLDQQLITQPLQNYEKLLEDTASLNPSSNGSNNTSLLTNSSECCKTSQANEINWRPLPDDYDPECIVNNSNEDWPDLLKTKTNKECKLSSKNSIPFCNEIANSNSSSSSSRTNCDKSTNFLERFIEPEYLNKSTESSKSNKLPKEPESYAFITKKVEKPKKAFEKINPTEFPAFYTPRKMYALKRNPK